MTNTKPYVDLSAESARQDRIWGEQNHPLVGETPGVRLVGSYTGADLVYGYLEFANGDREGVIVEAANWDALETALAAYEQVCAERDDFRTSARMYAATVDDVLRQRDQAVRERDEARAKAEQWETVAKREATARFHAERALAAATPDRDPA